MSELQVAVLLKQHTGNGNEPYVQQLQEPDQRHGGIHNRDCSENDCEQGCHEGFELTGMTPEEDCQRQGSQRQQDAKTIKKLRNTWSVDHALRVEPAQSGHEHFGKKREIRILFAQRRQDIHGQTTRGKQSGEQSGQRESRSCHAGTTANNRHFAEIIRANTRENCFSHEQRDGEAREDEKRIPYMVENGAQKSERKFKFVQHAVQRHGQRFARIGLILFSFPLFAPLAFAGPCEPHQTIVAVQRPDGRSMFLGVEPAALSSFLQQRLTQTNKEADRLDHMAQAIVRIETATAFDRAQAQVPAFANWVYGWASNYVFSYELLFAAATSGARSIKQGEPILANMENTVRHAVETAFQRRVLDPIQFDATLDNASREAMDEGRAEWKRFLEREARLWEQFAETHCVMLTVPAGVNRIVIDLRTPSLNAAGASAPEHPAVDPSQQFAIRALRPLGVRALMLGLRLAEIGSIAALPAALGVAGAPGFIAGAVLTTGTVWLIDYSINATDAALHRSAFEQDLITRLGAVKEKTDEALAQGVAAGFSRMMMPYRDSLNRKS